MRLWRGGSTWAEVEPNGSIWVDGARVGEVDGTYVWRDGSRVGEIESGGAIYHEGSRVGEIESSGAIYHEGSRWGEVDGGWSDVAALHKIAAAVVFFGGLLG